MTPFASLWLPLLLSTVFVFIVSSIIHMAPLWHKNDYPKMANEDAFRAALKGLAIIPGDYVVPRADCHADMKKPEYLEKLNQGPVMMLTVLPNGPFKMAGSLVQWLLFCGVVGLTAACVAGTALKPGADPLQIFHFTAVTALAGYVLGLWQMSIWYKRSWLATLKSTFDGLIYAATTAGTFVWLWPK
jgi:hypothetical protein